MLPSAAAPRSAAKGKGEGVLALGLGKFRCWFRCGQPEGNSTCYNVQVEMGVGRGQCCPCTCCAIGQPANPGLGTPQPSPPAQPRASGSALSCAPQWARAVPAWCLCRRARGGGWLGLEGMRVAMQRKHAGQRGPAAAPRGGNAAQAPCSAGAVKLTKCLGQRLVRHIIVRRPNAPAAARRGSITSRAAWLAACRGLPTQSTSSLRSQFSLAQHYAKASTPAQAVSPSQHSHYSTLMYMETHWPFTTHPPACE